MQDSEGNSDQILAKLQAKLHEFNESIYCVGPEILLNYLKEKAASIKLSLELDFSKRNYAIELIELAINKNLFYNDTSEYLNKGPEYLKKTDAEINLKKWIFEKEK